MHKKKRAVFILMVLLTSAIICRGVVWSRTVIRDPLPVLMYHHIVTDSEECNDMCITPERLEEDLQWLSDNGYTTVLPRELVAGEIPKKPVLITFDDGYLSNYELAYPLLQKYQAKAVISIVVFMQNCKSNKFLSWSMCREMAASGLVEIGSHSYALHNLDGRNGMFTPDGVNGVERIPDESDDAFQTRVLDDIQKSYDLIAENVGTPPVFFAYPFGRNDPDADPYIQSLFPVTAGTQARTADLTLGLYDLPRYTVTMWNSVAQILDPAAFDAD